MSASPLKFCILVSSFPSAEAEKASEKTLHCVSNDNILDVAPTTILIPNDADAKEAVFAAIGADKDPATSSNAFNPP